MEEKKDTKRQYESYKDFATDMSYENNRKK